MPKLQPLASMPTDEMARAYLPTLRHVLWGRPVAGPGGSARG
ncbi:hypothetical protein [Kitasatospora sp. NPDC002965]